MAKRDGRTYKLSGFRKELRKFRDKILPENFNAFQKGLGLELYKRILEKTPVDTGMLRGAWTISVGQQDRQIPNTATSAENGGVLTSEELSKFQAAMNSIPKDKIGKIIWLNNAMPYILVIEFEGHSSKKAPAGMVQISINEIKTWLKSSTKIAIARGKTL